jgi:hypothetical protein
MRIVEILFWNNEPTEGHRFDPQLYLPHDPSSQTFLEPEGIGGSVLWTPAVRRRNRVDPKEHIGADARFPAG